MGSAVNETIVDGDSGEVPQLVIGSERSTGRPLGSRLFHTECAEPLDSQATHYTTYPVCE